MIDARTARQNQLLASVPDAELERWLPYLEAVDLPLGKVLYESGTRLSYVYFPTTAIVSLLYLMEDGASAEIAVVGFEGLVGISLFSFRLLFAYHDMPTPDLTVKATGNQWNWSYEYPDHGIGEYISTMIPEDEIASRGMPHSLYRLAAEKAPFGIPVKDAFRFTSGFGSRWGRLHAGTDFAAAIISAGLTATLSTQ